MVPQRLSVYLLVLWISACCGHIGGGVTTQDVHPQVYCGKSLSNAIALFCYDKGDMYKRSESGLYNSIISPYYKERENELAGWPWMPAQRARSMILPSRGKRGEYIVDECCLKACSINELLSYCQN